MLRSLSLNKKKKKKLKSVSHTNHKFTSLGTTDGVLTCAHQPHKANGL